MDGAPCFETVEPLLAGTAPDALLVTTPPALHAATAEKALSRGLAVLVERPMALSLVEAHRVLERQRRSACPARVGFNRRFRMSYTKLRERIRTDGAPSRMVFTLIADARRWNSGVPDVSSPQDVLHDTGSHAMDLVAHLARSSIRRVRTEARNDAGRWCVVEIEVELENGATARCAVGHAPRYEEHLSVTTAGHSYVVDTSGRSMLAQAKAKGALALRQLAGRPTPTDQTFRAQLAAFAAACRGEAEPEGADAQAGFAAVAAVERCLESLARGGDWCEVPRSSPARREQANE